jgi:Acetyl-CoA hydrolase/transferase C-terminal domain
VHRAAELIGIDGYRGGWLAVSADAALLVDKVVTEHGVAELRGRTIRQRAAALIAIAAPAFRDELRGAAKRLGYL